MEVDAAVCPVCTRRFPLSADGGDGAAFALHVAECTAPPASSVAPLPSSAPAFRHCPMCLHVYAHGTLPHEITFHEHECARMNDRPKDKSAGGARQSNKRQRERPSDHASDDDEPVVSAVKLFPTECFLCGTGGRSLLRCEGICARVFHFNCVEELQAPVLPNSDGAGASNARKAQQQNWTCAECFRGIHRCHECGFLGSDAKELIKCSIVDCGYFFHRQCLPGTSAVEQHSPLICPRHTCVKCGSMETDMSRCLSCTKCYTTTHLRCRPGTTPHSTADANPHANAPAPSSGLGSGSQANLHVCATCAASKPTVKPSEHLGSSLRRRCANGDIVLILEYNNALLPATAKNASPDVYNQWGVVVNAEAMEPAGSGNQLLSVNVFSDNSHIIIPNRYVLRVGSANSFGKPADMLFSSLKWHAMVELNLRQPENGSSPTGHQEILKSCCAAFRARLDALSISTAQALTEAERGHAALQSFRAQSAPRRYQDEPEAPSGAFAPVYMFLDTRGTTPIDGNHSMSSTTDQDLSERTGHEPAAPNDDVDMGETPGGNEEEKSEERGSAGGARFTSRAMSPGDVANSTTSVVSSVSVDIESATTAADVEVNDTAVVHSHPSTVALDDKTPVDSHQTDTAKTLAPAEETPVSEEMVGIDEEMNEEEPCEGASSGEAREPDIASRVVAKGCENDTPSTTGVAKMGDDASGDAEINAHNGTKQKVPVSLDTNLDADLSPKRAKLAHDTSVETTPTASSTAAAVYPSLPAASTFKISPASTFARAVQHMADKEASGMNRAVPQKRKGMTRKQKTLAEYPPALIDDLERDVEAFFQHGKPSACKQQRLPKDADSFPWAAHAALFRPAFYRPTVVMNRARGLRRVESVSRLLVSQDKRSLKCYIQSTPEAPPQCPSSMTTISSGYIPPFVVVDLLAFDRFSDLAAAVRTKLALVLEDRPLYTKELFQMEPRAALRWLEQQQRKPTSDRQVHMALWYCCYDGNRKQIALDETATSQSQQQRSAEWLCFCANVCHLTLVVSLPHTRAAAEKATSTPSTTQVTTACVQ